MRLYNLVILESGFVQGQADQLASVRAWWEASERYRQENAFDEFNIIDAEVAAPENYQDEDWFAQLGINRFPVLLISDANGGPLVAKLVGGQITSNNIYNILGQIRDLETDPSTGTSITPDGRPLGEGGLFPGFGLGNNSLIWLLLAGAAAYTVSKK